ncbi:hypothetical protein [Aestuariivivens sp. NBU2969]|uniref:hypothetical protein n=1 Tax=Aestuariivivens sp. NBU2969 TaxID=2873267 RepID=UPI001CC1A4EC|nr:hypothetical protein [Aestuariivivens sp. NBU2969]
MALYWAKFLESNGNLYRINTRIYLNDIQAPLETDKCIGAVVGKNPGSAKPNENNQLGKLREINLENDKLLPTVRNIILKSVDFIKKGDYIQVLNLFYLCNPDLNEAISEFNRTESPLFCPSESSKFNWVWFLWGGSNTDLNTLKTRFKSINSPKPFFYVQKEKVLKQYVPLENDKARHTQGMSHADVIPLLNKIINI